MPRQNENEPAPCRTITEPWKELLGRDYLYGWGRQACGLYERHNLFPLNCDNVFRAFAECPLDCLKVVILGEQPYNNIHADGLAFSTSQTGAVPASLWIIFSEICHDIRLGVSHTNGDLTRWARQGVLLLNSWLTIGQNGDNIRWGDFTGRVIHKISERQTPIVFMLWGERAIRKSNRINNQGRHLILKSSHPSPRGAFRCVQQERPFVGCRHFSQANNFLSRSRAVTVHWR